MTSVTPFLVDLHCHLDLYPDFEGIVRESEAAGIKTLAVTTTPRAFPRNLELTRNTRHIRAALGLHPQLVADSANEIDRFAEFLPQTRYVGEVGLDASPPHRASFALQERVFTRVLDLCAEAGGKILSVHAVRASTPVLDLIEAKLSPGRGRVVLHWFTGSAEEARRAVELGCYFSVNGEMLRHPRHRSTVTTVIPVTRLLTETDGPFVRKEGQSIRPVDVSATVDDLAATLRAAPEKMREQIAQNLRTLLIGFEPPT